MSIVSARRQERCSLREPGAIVLVSCYELGQQPLALADADAHFRRAGFLPRSIDIDVDGFDEGLFVRARLAAISVPMHTALRIGVAAAKRIRAINPQCHIAFFGLYAALNAAYLLDDIADSCYGGEYETALVDLATSMESGTEPGRRSPDVHREFERARSMRGLMPSRDGLPPLARYVRLIRNRRSHVVASVVTTRGCKHQCRHCPVVPIYNGRFYAIPLPTVMGDIRQVVASGAEHISFGDPDFLNGPAHARRIARALHHEFPSLTFDFTAKIEHLMRQRALVRELQEMGCVLVVSAVESLSDRVLAALDKGHSATDVRETVRFFKAVGLALRPTLIPFTPWETLDTLQALMTFVAEEDMLDHIDPVQFTIRLLVPPGSLLATSPLMRPHLGALERAEFTYPWRHPDESMDALHPRLVSLVATANRLGEDPVAIISQIAQEVALAAGRPAHAALEPIRARFASDRLRPPQLTETGFC